MASNALTLDPSEGEDYGDMPLPALSQPGTGAFGGPAPALHAQSPFALPTRPVVVTPPTAPPPVMAPKRPPEMQGLDPASALALGKARAQVSDQYPAPTEIVHGDNAFGLDPRIFATLKSQQGGTDQDIYAPGSKPMKSSGFMNALAQIESANQNIYSRVDPDVAGPGTRSQGYFQINTPTWQEFGPKAGVDLKQYPNAMSAPREVQEQVARAIPLSRFGPRTRNMLAAQYGIDSNSHALIGDLEAGHVGGTGASNAAAGAPQPPKGPFAGAQGSAPGGPLSGQGGDDKLRQLVLLQALWPHFQFKNVQYDPYAVAAVGHND